MLVALLFKGQLDNTVVPLPLVRMSYRAKGRCRPNGLHLKFNKDLIKVVILPSMK